MAPTVTPPATTELPDGRVVVQARQVVRDLAGHERTSRAGLVARTDVEA